MTPSTDAEAHEALMKTKRRMKQLKQIRKYWASAVVVSACSLIVSLVGYTLCRY